MNVDLFPLASFAHLHGGIYLVVSCVLFVERGDQVEEVVEDRGDGGRGKVRGGVLRFGGAQSLEHRLHVAERRLDCACCRLLRARFRPGGGSVSRTSVGGCDPVIRRVVRGFCGKINLRTRAIPRLVRCGHTSSQGQRRGLGIGGRCKLGLVRGNSNLGNSGFWWFLALSLHSAHRLHESIQPLNTARCTLNHASLFPNPIILSNALERRSDARTFVRAWGYRYGASDIRADGGALSGQGGVCVRGWCPVRVVYDGTTGSTCVGGCGECYGGGSWEGRGRGGGRRSQVEIEGECGLDGAIRRRVADGYDVCEGVGGGHRAGG